MIRHLSFAYKVPLSLGLVILITATVVSGTLIARAYDDTRITLQANTASLGNTLVHTLRPALLHDDLWQAYETLRAPFNMAPGQSRRSNDHFILLDSANRIYVSSDPKAYPSNSPILAIDAGLAAFLHAQAGTLLEDPAHQRMVMALPVLAEDKTRLGVLVITTPLAALKTRFTQATNGVLLATLVVLVMLLPLSWFWGKRLTAPLKQLADCMGRIGHEPPANIDCSLYEGNDEIGVLADRFKNMLKELQQKQAMEKQMLSQERLAALGRLSAGIAHEINNPLGGMLNAINTHKRYHQSDEAIGKTLSLLERGLTQIRETVQALLVESRLESHALKPEDLDDVRTLIQAEAQHKSVALNWHSGITAPLPLPSTQVRQVLLNLLLNAVQAAPSGSAITVRLHADENTLIQEVENGGDAIPDDRMQHLFEPFAHHNPEGHGLGLWITYQLVQQLGGRIQAHSRPGQTLFTVQLPMCSC